MASFWDAATTYLLSPRNIAKYSNVKPNKVPEEKEMTMFEIATSSPTIYPDLHAPNSPEPKQTTVPPHKNIVIKYPKGGK